MREKAILGEEMEELKLKVKDIESTVMESKNQINETQKEVIELRAVVSNHIVRNDERDERLSKSVSEIKEGLDAHMREEMKYHEERKGYESTMDMRMAKGFSEMAKEVTKAITDLDKKVMDTGFKTKIMWSVMLTLGASAIGLAVGILQTFTEDKVMNYPYDNEPKYEKRIESSPKYKEVLRDKGVIIKE